MANLKIAKTNDVAKTACPMVNQDYRTYFCDMRYCVDTAFKIMEATTNRAEQLELLKTLARIVREKTRRLEEKERSA